MFNVSLQPEERKLHPNILITGGSGFLGHAIIREILEPGSLLSPGILRIFDLDEYKGQQDPRIEFIKGDIRRQDQISGACTGMDIVLHVAAIVDWGTKPEKEVYETNVNGTRNVIRACFDRKVGILVFTSSLDAVFSGHPLVDIDETLLYPEHHTNMYCMSKCNAEKLILQANSDQLKTCVLRPAEVYGEGDPFHIGSLISMAKGGFYVRIGNGKSRSQHVYSGNIAYAEIMAASALLSGNKSVCGNVYFITDGPPSNFFTFYDHIVESSGYRIRPKNLWIPKKIAYLLGSINEGIAFLFRPVIKYSPALSRFAVIYTCSDFTFTAGKAKRDFGYYPKYSPEEALARTVSFYKVTKPKSHKLSLEGAIGD